jgi:hypothetical protein
MKNKPKKFLRPSIQYLNEIWPVSQKSLATPGLDSVNERGEQWNVFSSNWIELK